MHCAYAYGDNTPYGIDMVQARDVWDSDRDGAIDLGVATGTGRTVCIIDSGLYTAHEDFIGVNVIGGYPANYATDTCGHGTHVAGTIVANLNQVGVVGVNPGTTSLYIVKVFGDNCEWTYSSTLVDAANRCSAAGANVISMSLGGTKSLKTEERAFSNLYNQGILSIAAAGNDGNTAISYPGGYSSVIAVAAIDETKIVADFSQQNSTVEIAAPGVGVESTVPYIETSQVIVDGVSYDANHVEFALYGSATGVLANGGLCDAVDSGLSGKVALCERGVISFYDKVLNATNSGAEAVIIYNNLPGNDLFTLGEEISPSKVVVSLSQEDGKYLVANKLGTTATISSTIEWNVNGYEFYDGTSMATPHVSGVAALVWSANPSWTNIQIREALTSTAFDLGETGRDVAYGYGLVQAKAALDKLGGGPVDPPVGGTLFVNVATDKTSYLNNQTAMITVTVTDGTNPVSGASVAVVITTPKATTVNLSGTTGTNGTVTLSYRIMTKKTGTGIFNIVANASKDGYTSGSGTASFTVQ